MRQFQEGLQPGLLLVAKELDLGPVVGAADDGQGGDQEDGFQGMAPGLGPSGIIDRGEQGHQGDRSRVGHEGNLLGGTKSPILPMAGIAPIRMRLPWEFGFGSIYSLAYHNHGSTAMDTGTPAVGTPN